MADDFFPVSVPVELTKNTSTPASPVAGTLALYAKSDDKLYTQTSAGVETQVGAGGSGTRSFAYFMS